MRQLMSIALVALVFSVNPVFAGDEFSLSGNAAAPEYTVMPPRDFADVKLVTAATIFSQSSVAVNPKNANVLLATFIAQGSCWVRASTNAGRTWVAAKKLPIPPNEPCEHPALIWAPDGSRVYAAYGYYGGEYNELTTVVVSSSTDKGLTWSPPKTAFSMYYFSLSSLKLATQLSGSDARWVYLLADLLDFTQEVLFIRSSDQGQTWSGKRNIIGVTCGRTQPPRRSLAAPEEKSSFPTAIRTTMT